MTTFLSLVLTPDVQGHETFVFEIWIGHNKVQIFIQLLDIRRYLTFIATIVHRRLKIS